MYDWSVGVRVMWLGGIFLLRDALYFENRRSVGTSALFACAFVRATPLELEHKPCRRASGLHPRSDSSGSEL